MKKRFATVVGFVAVGALAVGCSGGPSGGPAGGDAKFPAKDITMIVPYQAGGASDLAARTLASEMEPTLGVSIVVENRTGGAGSVGLGALASAKNDGYTIGYMPVETVMLSHNGYDIDPAKYAYLGQIVGVPATVAVPANSKYQTLDELLADAKANPDTITVGNSGAGSIWEAATIALGKAAGTSFRPVPFDGGAPAVTAAIGNQINAVVAGPSETSQAHKDGQLRILAVLADDPIASLPEVKTAKAQGVDLSIGGWGLVGGPKGMPEAVVTVYDEAVKKAVASDKYSDVITKAGNLPEWHSAADSEAFVTSEAARFGDLLSSLR
ncbi:MAG: tripartite tricarboxylate transporter substrate binding protein [Propioniciclava sp.]|uniref:tripartite tricarboxylate transporter substrate binding protein n=1 Tax=Propioniciclava sp. TaxID=2038686 RepID=UPI0039E3782C